MSSWHRRQTAPLFAPSRPSKQSHPAARASRHVVKHRYHQPMLRSDPALGFKNSSFLTLMAGAAQSYEAGDINGAETAEKGGCEGAEEVARSSR